MKISTNEKIVKRALFLFILFLPFWRIGSLFSFIIILALSLLKQYKKPTKLTNIYFLPLILYHIILMLFKEIHTIDFIEFYRILILLLLFPIAFNSIKKGALLQSVQLFVFSVFVMQMVVVFNLINFFIKHNKFPVLRSSSNVNEILQFGRPTLGFLSAIAILFSIQLFLKFRTKINLWFILLSTFIVFYISARLSMILIFVYMLFYGFVLIKSVVYKRLYLSGLVIGIIIFLGFGNSTLNHRMILIKDDSRVIIWKNAVKIIEENKQYLFGTNNRHDVVEKLKEKFSKDTDITYLPTKNRFLNANYSTHNQFLDEMIIGGIIGVVLLLFPFIYLLNKAFKRKDTLGILLLMSMLAFMFVENVFERQLGVFLFGYLFIIIDNDLFNTGIHLTKVDLFSRFSKYLQAFVIVFLLSILISKLSNNKNQSIVKVAEHKYVLNKEFKIGDVRRYGIFPDRSIGKHPISKKSKMETVFDIAESGIELSFPRGFYKTSIRIQGRENITLNFNDCTFKSIIQITESKEKNTSNIKLKGKLTTLVQFYIRNSTKISIDTLIVKSDTLKSLNHKRSLGASIHHHTEYLTIKELIVEDMGSYGNAYKYSRAAVEIHGLNNEPKNIFIKKINVKSSDRTGVYISGENIIIKEIIIDKFGIGSKKDLLPLEGGLKGEGSQFSGVWINKCFNSKFSKIDISLDESKGDFSVNFDIGQTFRPVIVDTLIINNTTNSPIQKKISDNSGVKINKSILNE